MSRLNKIAFPPRIKQYLDDFGRKISEDKLIKFDYKVISLVLISFLTFSLLVVFRIHGSSIPIWNQIITDSHPKDGLILGTPKGTRSDEWDVGTPFALSQARSDPKFPLSNETLGGGNVPLLTNIPARHISTLFRPQHWGYFLFNTERGFSFYWNFKTFSLFLGFFFLLMLLTRNNFGLSLLGSLWVLFSNYLQWWFSIPLPEMVASFSIVFVSLIYLIFSKKRLSIILSGILLLVFSINFVLFFYPPFQVVLGYLLLFLLAGYLIQNFSTEALVKSIKLKMIVVLVAAVISAIVLYFFYVEAKGTIALIMGTVYPGSRRSIGGGISLFKYFSGFYNVFMVEQNYPKILINISEASNFILLYPVVLVSLVINYLNKKKINILIISTMIYIVLITIYVSFGFPSFISKATLWSFATTERSLLGLGIASIISCILFLNIKKEFLKDKYIYLVSLFSFIAMLMLGVIAKAYTGDFFRYRWLILMALLITITVFSLLKRKKILFSFMIFSLVVAPAFLINPISIGLSPIYNKEVSVLTYNESQQNPDSKWAVYGDRLTPNFFIANGLRVFDGVKYTPDFEYLKALDPKGEYKNVYNRYAHIALMEPENKEKKINFKLIYPDHYVIYINPCSEKLKEIGITHLAFSHKPDESILHCVEPLTGKPLNNLWLYKYK
ncbi:MAG: hypothetical protein GTN40_00185 [Candidatus Aenigmarchaeota archaeon]|nr:hypothetical protein [Candidatus Aenigmarchaeota archaeon]